MNNLNLYADSTLNGGTYDHIKIYGSTTVNGDLNALSMKIYGASKFNAPCDVKEMNIFGASTFEGNVRSQRLSVKGSTTFNSDVNVDLLKIHGAVSFNNLTKSQEIHVFGAVSGKVIESNQIRIEGALRCDELNADHVEINTNDTCKIKEIVGSKIVVKQKKHLLQKSRGNVQVDLIEGDEIEIDHVEAKVVRGSKIIVGPNCVIDSIEYKESLEVSEKSQVNQKVKVE